MSVQASTGRLRGSTAGATRAAQVAGVASNVPPPPPSPSPSLSLASSQSQPLSLLSAVAPTAARSAAQLSRPPPPPAPSFLSPPLLPPPPPSPPPRPSASPSPSTLPRTPLQQALTSPSRPPPALWAVAVLLLLLLCLSAIGRLPGVAAQVTGAQVSSSAQQITNGVLNAILSLGSSQQRSLCADKVTGVGGYNCEEYTVTTEDGYILALQRVTSANQGTPQLAVFLMHGVMVGGNMWFHTVPGQNWDKQFLPFYLADAGHEVWIANARATLYSNAHVTLSASDSKYWQWSWEHNARYDFPAMVQCAARNSRARARGLHFIGHGLGNLVGMAGITNPAIAPLVASATLIAPAVFLNRVGSALLAMWSYITGPAIDSVLVNADFNNGKFDYYLEGGIIINRTDNSANFSSSIFGTPCCTPNRDFANLYLETNGWDGVTAYRNLQHVQQVITGGELRQFDFGSRATNRQLYGSTGAPYFRLQNIPPEFPILFIHGGADRMANVQNVGVLRAHLKGNPLHLLLPDYSHFDLIYSRSVGDDVFGPVLVFLDRQLSAATSATPDVAYTSATAVPTPVEYWPATTTTAAPAATAAAAQDGPAADAASDQAPAASAPAPGSDLASVSGLAAGSAPISAPGSDLADSAAGSAPAFDRLPSPSAPAQASAVPPGFAASQNPTLGAAGQRGLSPNAAGETDGGGGNGGGTDAGAAGNGGASGGGGGEGVNGEEDTTGEAIVVPEYPPALTLTSLPAVAVNETVGGGAASPPAVAVNGTGGGGSTGELLSQPGGGRGGTGRTAGAREGAASVPSSSGTPGSLRGSPSVQAQGVQAPAPARARAPPRILT